MFMTLKKFKKVVMKMKTRTYVYALIVSASGSLLLTACNRTPDSTEKPAASAQQQDVMKQLQTPPPKSFDNTPQDAQDIAALDDFEQRFNAMNSDMEAELIKLQKSGDLTPEFERNRKADTVNSALQMLKALDLKTEQGRYIQGLFYQYWDIQAKAYSTAETSAASSTAHSAPMTQGLGHYLQAQEQLRHWKEMLKTKS